MSWYLAATVSQRPEDLYIYINDPSSESIAAAGYLASQLGEYSQLDYAIIGGGGGGGSSERTGSGGHYGGGGGGSGFLVASFNFNSTIGNYIYQIVVTPPVTSITSPDINSNTISLANYKSITVTLGNGGPAAPTPSSGASVGNSGFSGNPTIITVTYNDNTTVTRTVYGGVGGGPGNDTTATTGYGGAGWNGGGGASGGAGFGGSVFIGIGGDSYGGTTGTNGSVTYAGEGGGIVYGGVNQGGDNNSSPTNDLSENAGGGGGGGTAVIVPPVGNRTGGQGSASYQTVTNQSSGPGIDFTGGAGGGGSNNVASGVMNASGGGKGYAIIWLH